MRFACAAFVAVLLFCSSCAKEKASRTIVTKIREEQAVLSASAMPDTRSERRFVWGDGTYEAVIERRADRELPEATDADGNRYYDNEITLSVSGPSGRIVERRFHKSDFSQYIPSDYMESVGSVLLNLVFYEVRRGEAVFIATVGEADALSDVYVQIGVNVSKTGDVSYSGLLSE